MISEKVDSKGHKTPIQNRELTIKLFLKKKSAKVRQFLVIEYVTMNLAYNSVGCNLNSFAKRSIN